MGCTAAVAASLAAWATPAGAAADQSPDRLIVGFSASMSTSSARRATLAAAGVSLDGERGAPTSAPAHVGSIDRLGVELITVPAARREALMARLQMLPGVEYVERDGTTMAAWTPNDPSLSSQWGITKVGAPTAWNTALGINTTVAVVDTGVDYGHPDLVGRVDKGYDFVANDANPMDENNHGTHVAGIIAAATNNGIGIAGMAPSARILAVRVLNSSGSGYDSWLASGITYAADKGAKVINLSVGASTGTTTLRNALLYAVNKGAVVTCAAGNNGTGTLLYPAAWSECLSVGASDSNDARASFSNYGTNLDVMAPGTRILSTVRAGGYQYWSGTSMATPFVSGVAALLAGQGRSRMLVESAITSTAKDLGAAGYDKVTGYGRINAAAAVAKPLA